jgi:hypothetical protein
MGMSTSRYLPVSGTAGFARFLVNGNRRVPAPPPITMARVSDVEIFGCIAFYSVVVSLEHEDEQEGICL